MRLTPYQKLLVLDVPDADEQLAAPENAQMQALEALGYIDPD